MITRGTYIALEQLAEELLRRVLVPAALHQDIEDIAVLIHRPPQVMAFTIDGEEHLIQMPLVARPGRRRRSSLAYAWPNFRHHLADGFVGDDDPTGEQQLFDISIAEAEAEIEPDAVADDLGREAMVLIVG